MRTRIFADHRKMILDSMKVNPWYSTIEIVLTLLLSVFCIIWGIKALELGYWYLIPVIIIFISALQHRLSILQHEAIHNLLFKNKLLNDSIGLYIIGPSLGILPNHSRQAHLSHHAHLGTEQDLERFPYMEAPLTRNQFISWSFLKITGLESCLRLIYLVKLSISKNIATSNTRIDKGRYIADWLPLIVIQSILVGIFSITCGLQYYFLFWLLPLMTTTRYLMGVRSIVEHAARKDLDDPEIRFINSIHCNQIEAFFLGPMHFNYHAEHHLFPKIPSWRWLYLKNSLTNHADFQSGVVIHKSYIGFLLQNLK